MVFEMKNITERHEYILNKLKEDGKVNILELINLMEVSGVTIRKDLKVLEDKKLLFRTRGGGSIHNPYANERITTVKPFLQQEEKKRIAKAALCLIESSDSICIGSGTTVFELAKQLYPNSNITVITPALKVGLELSNRPNVEVLQVGGLVRPNSTSVYGAHAERILSDISCEILFLGVDGIDIDFGFSTTNFSEATISQKMIAMAQTVVILADSTKLEKKGLIKICAFDQVNYLITDKKINQDLINQIEEKGVKVIIA